MSLATVDKLVNQSKAVDMPLLDSTVTEGGDIQTINAVLYAVLYATNYVITPILCILGIVGNVLNIIVLRHCGFKDTNVLFLESLSLADLILSAVHSVLHVHYFVELVDVVAASVVGSYSYIYLFGPYNTLMCVVQCYLVAIAVERVIAVYFPFHVARIFTSPRVLICIASLYSFTIVLYLPHSMLFEVAWVDIPSVNQTLATLRPTQFFLVHFEILDTYTLWATGKFADTVLPGTIILCCVAVGLKLWRRKKQFLPKVTKKKKESNDLNGVRLLMVVCVVSVLFAVPGQVMIYFFAVIEEFSGPFHQLLLDFTNMICQLFSSTNFIIYVTMSKNFFRTYRKLVYGCW